MQKPLKYIVLTFVVLIFTSFTRTNNQPWDLTSTQNNINIYTKINENSKLKNVKIKATFDVDFDRLISIINDVNEYDQWIYKCYGNKIIERVNKNECYYYVKSNFPFPLNDRDLVIHSTQTYDKQNRTFSSQSIAVPNKIDNKEGLVRVKEFESSWNIAENKDGTVNLEYIISSDPAGYIPAWIINMAVTQAPTKSMQNLRKIVKNKMK